MRRSQTQTHTHLFRRTDVLRSARAQLETTSGRTLKILSFGCSTGEEIVSLRYLFPDAEIFGCEIDPATLAIAIRSVGHLATIFSSSADAIAAHGPFDLINCSAVLCLNPPKDIAVRFPSTQFDEMLLLLDSALAPGGLLAITNASYRFYGSPLVPRYDPVRSDLISSSGFVDVFAHDGRPFLKRIPKYPRATCRRGPAFEIHDEEELADSIFRKRIPGEQSGPRTLRLAPVPEGFQSAFEFRRSNLDEMDVTERENAIEVVRLYRFGIDAVTGDRGCTIEISWDSGRGRHTRPPVWTRMEDFPFEE